MRNVICSHKAVAAFPSTQNSAAYSNSSPVCTKLSWPTDAAEPGAREAGKWYWSSGMEEKLKVKKQQKLTIQANNFKNHENTSMLGNATLEETSQKISRAQVLFFFQLSKRIATTSKEILKQKFNASHIWLFYVVAKFTYFITNAKVVGFSTFSSYEYYIFYIRVHSQDFLYLCLTTDSLKCVMYIHEKCWLTNDPIFSKGEGEMKILQTNYLFRISFPNLGLSPHFQLISLYRSHCLLIPRPKANSVPISLNSFTCLSTSVLIFFHFWHFARCFHFFRWCELCHSFCWPLQK